MCCLVSPGHLALPRVTTDSSVMVEEGTAEAMVAMVEEVVVAVVDMAVEGMEEVDTTIRGGIALEAIKVEAGPKTGGTNLLQHRAA